MAYLEQYAKQCHSCHNRFAYYRLLRADGSLVGLFCKQCGEREFRLVQSAEDRKVRDGAAA
jgi:hypothetical protein